MHRAIEQLFGKLPKRTGWAACAPQNITSAIIWSSHWEFSGLA
jgi:hypothetical protein